MEGTDDVYNPPNIQNDQNKQNSSYNMLVSNRKKSLNVNIGAPNGSKTERGSCKTQSNVKTPSLIYKREDLIASRAQSAKRENVSQVFITSRLAKEPEHGSITDRYFDLKHVTKPKIMIKKYITRNN